MDAPEFPAEFTLDCERLLAEGVADVATELRLVNVIDLIGYVRSERSANLEDLVNSSAELYFKQGALRYAWSADIDVVWEALPSVSLNMEFCWRGITAFFRLCLNSARAGVDIQHVAFDASCEEAAALLALFTEAIADSRLTPPRRPSPSLMSRGANF
jgi:hypothetical protein